MIVLVIILVIIQIVIKLPLSKRKIQKKQTVNVLFLTLIEGPIIRKIQMKELPIKEMICLRKLIFSKETFWQE